MADGRYISERDLPAFRELIKLHRSGGLRPSLQKPQRTPPPRYDRRVILLEPCASYGTVWAAWTQREAGLNAIDLRTLGFVTGGTFALEIVAGGALYRTPTPIAHNASARELLLRIADCADGNGNRPFKAVDLRTGIGGQPDPDDATVTLSPGRWIIEFGGRWAAQTITVRPQWEPYHDPFDSETLLSSGLTGSVIEMHANSNDWFDAGQLLEVHLNQPIEDPNPLRAGSICNVTWIDSSGWVIHTAEPRKYVDDTAPTPDGDPYPYST